MEERRTNKHGLGLGLNVRREKFLALFCASVAIASMYPSKIPTQLPGTLTHPLTLADPASGSTIPNSSFSSCLSLTVAFPLTVVNFSLFTTLGPCLSSSSSGLVGNLVRKLFVQFSRQNRQRNPLTGAHPHPHPQNEYPLSCHKLLNVKRLFTIVTIQ